MLLGIERIVRLKQIDLVPFECNDGPELDLTLLIEPVLKSIVPRQDSQGKFCLREEENGDDRSSKKRRQYEAQRRELDRQACSPFGTRIRRGGFARFRIVSVQR